MNPNYLATKKEQVKYWSKISSLAFAFGLPVIKLVQQPPNFSSEEWQELSLSIKVFLLLIVLLGISDCLLC